MNEGLSFEINKSSLISLKAEVLRKKDEIEKKKIDPEKHVAKPFSKIIERMKSTTQMNKIEDDDNIDEDISALNSQAIMERKALLYEKLANSKNDEDCQDTKRYLVQFNKKIKHSNNKVPVHQDVDFDEFDDWVEYTDCLGRTRKCLKDDIEFMKNKDFELKESLGTSNRVQQISKNEVDFEVTKNEQIASIKQKWFQKEEELKDKTNIHYQDILFDEARGHGVGYYAFSENEEERRKQQEALQRLRDETMKNQQSMRAQKKVRKRLMKLRVHAAMNRKRVRQGLEPLEMVDDEDSDESDHEKEETSNEIIDSVEKKKDEQRRNHIRPWDIGKTDLDLGKRKKSYKYTQEEWIAEKRKERKSEFAPPVSPKCSNEMKNDQIDEYVTRNLSILRKHSEKKES